ncbi:hypothetical protein V8E36_007108 [Tilletia maclaganii]
MLPNPPPCRHSSQAYTTDDDDDHHHDHEQQRSPKRRPPSNMWLSMAPETDPAAPPIQDHHHNNNAAASTSSAAGTRNKAGSTFVGVGAPEMLLPFSMRTRTASSGSSISPSLRSLRMSSFSNSVASSARLPGKYTVQQQQQSSQQGGSPQDDDESDEDPCCTPDHVLAQDAMMLLASSTTFSSLRDTSVGLPPQPHHQYHSAADAPVKLVKTPGASSQHEHKTDYFSMSTLPSSTAPGNNHLGIGPATGGSGATMTNSTATASTVASPPDFDYRNSFAPIAFNQAGGGLHSKASASNAAKVNGGGGIEFAGRQWSGLTAHAVEQEMEALGDRAIMSYAPDASYLAMRLEGLRRNLEASNWERRPNWVGWQEDEEKDTTPEAEREKASTSVASAKEADPVTSQTSEVSTDALLASRSLPPSSASVASSSATNRTISTLQATGNKKLHNFASSSSAKSEFALPPAPATSLIEAEYARFANLPKVDNIQGATLSAAERSRLAQASLVSKSKLSMSQGAGGEDEDADEADVDVDQTATPQKPPPLDPAVRAAALDARLELRKLKRDDLMQVRELHCYHGDGNKSPGRETYTMSAGFLLRLLVDEKHVAVVAVKRPIPAPESPLPSDLTSSMHARLSPGGPGAAGRQNHSPARTPNLPFVSSSLSRRGYAVARSNTSMDAQDEDDDDSDVDSVADVDGEEDGRVDGQGEVQEAEEQSPASQQSFYTSSSLLISASDGNGSRTNFTLATTVPDSEEEEEERAASLRQRSAVTPSSTVIPSAELSSAEHEAELPAHGMTLPPSVLPQSDSTLYERDADKPILAGPLPVAPPLAVRVMAAPPPLHRLRSSDSVAAILEGSESVVGVATAQLTTTEPLANELWPGIDADDTSARGAAVEQAHVLTLCVAPDERSQGLGARLLEKLMEECQIRIGHNSLRRPESISISGRARSMRTIVECHASNERVLALYAKAGFQRVPGPQGTKKNFYRGDDRIPLTYRLKVGGTDAQVFEKRIELP